MKTTQIYKSGEIHDHVQAHKYTKTHHSPHRFLAYRDVSNLISNFSDIKRVLDFGSGTGASSYYLLQQGYNVIGIDKSPSMVQEARLNFPQVDFVEIEKLPFLSPFDLVFSSFVLFELSNKEEIIAYLNLAAHALKEGGMFLGISGSEYLHQKERNWMCFNVNYTVNTHPDSGDIVKLSLKDSDIEFCDFYWKESDYKECFELSGLDLVQIHYPLGKQTDPFEWQDELVTPPFVMFLAKKRTK